jgi:outer membrane immunogenic protein
MRKLAVLSAVVAMVGGVNAASAADLSSRGGSYKDTPYEAPAAIWGGLYVGGHVGGLWNDGGDSSGSKQRKCHYGDSEVVARQPACENPWYSTDKIKFSEQDDDVSFIGGIHVGYNWQSDARVFGIEADVSFADNIDYLASLRARLGYAMDSLLIYATAGVAFAGFDDPTNFSLYGEKDSFGDDSKVGFVVGGGVEYKLSSNLSVGVEGLYYAFGDSDDSKEWDAYCKTWKADHSDDNDLFVVRARLSYHFQDEYAEPLK